MIVVTGGTGFIGGNLTRALVAGGSDVLVVDLVPPDERRTLEGVAISGFLTADEFHRRLTSRRGLSGVEAVLHQGACSSTTETDESVLRRMNDGYSEQVLDSCRTARVPLVYASSASVYGTSARQSELPGYEAPLNGYARSKARFDETVRAELREPGSPVVGLRYFNVYGPGEEHKAEMASLVLQLWTQLQATGRARIFGAGAGCGPGQHRRDFVHVDDVVAVVRWFLGHLGSSGIYNCGTGRSRTVLDLAQQVIGGIGAGEVEYIPFPPGLEGRYQSNTEADLSVLRAVGCAHEFVELEEGVTSYVRGLEAARDAGTGAPT